MEFIAEARLTSDASTLVVSSIPNTYTDLVLYYSIRTTTSTQDPQYFIFNGDTGTNYEMNMLFGTGGGIGHASNGSYLSQFNAWAIWWMQPSNYYANTFGNVKIVLPNYSSTDRFKPVSVDAVNANNDANGARQIGAGVWKSNAAINSVTVTPYNANFVAGSSVTVYGILAGSDGVTSVSTT